MKKSINPVIILGAGLAGLSAAKHLKNKPYLVFEKAHEVGGTARSFKIGDFTFDFTGHLLHLHHPYTKNLIKKLLRGNFYQCNRKTSIFSNDTYTSYPFQANTYGLPDSIIDECLLDLLNIHLQPHSRKKKYLNFKDWCESTFGHGISKHFMIPYNEKLYQTSAHKMSTDWCGPFVPTPQLEDVIRGSLKPTNIGFGYNQKFIYPKKGGIQVLSQQMAKTLKNIHLETSVDRVDWRKKTVHLSNGFQYPYSHIINTIPLTELLKRMKPLPQDIEKAGKKLKCVSILDINIGVKRPNISPYSWVYFPEKKFPFYRVGFPMNFTPHIVPKGCSSMYVEVPIDTTKDYSPKKIFKKVRKGLIEARILKPQDKFAVIQFLPIRYAYVIYNEERKKSLSKIFSFLHKNKIQSIGRYGEWKYSFMEEAILDGRRAAQKIN